MPINANIYQALLLMTGLAMSNTSWSTDPDWLAQAKSGDIQAQNYVGFLYMTGQGGFPKEPATAVKWFDQAAQHGNLEAAYNLGVLYEKGLGLQKNPQQALSWYEFSANHGYQPAMRRLQQIYHDGLLGQSPNKEKSTFWQQRMSSSDNVTSIPTAHSQKTTSTAENTTPLSESNKPNKQPSSASKETITSDDQVIDKITGDQTTITHTTQTYASDIIKENNNNLLVAPQEKAKQTAVNADDDINDLYTSKPNLGKYLFIRLRNHFKSDEINSTISTIFQQDIPLQGGRVIADFHDDGSTSLAIGPYLSAERLQHVASRLQQITAFDYDIEIRRKETRNGDNIPKSPFLQVSSNEQTALGWIQQLPTIYQDRLSTSFELSRQGNGSYWLRTGPFSNAAAATDALKSIKEKTGINMYLVYLSEWEIQGTQKQPK